MTAPTRHVTEGWHDRQVSLLGWCPDCPKTPVGDIPAVENVGGADGLGSTRPADDTWQQLRELMTSRVAYCRKTADDTWQGGRGAASRRWKLRHEADVTEAWLARMDVLERQQ